MHYSKIAAAICLAALTSCGRNAAQSQTHVASAASSAADAAQADTPPTQTSESPTQAESNAAAAADALPAVDDRGFALRVVNDLQELEGVSEAEFVTAHPTAKCFSPLENGRVCEVQRPPPSLCVGGVSCSLIDFGFKDSKLRSARITLSEREFAQAYRETKDALGEPDVRRHAVGGVCSYLETATYETQEARVQFEYAHCGATARAYGQQQAIIVSLRG